MPRLSAGRSHTIWGRLPLETEPIIQRPRLLSKPPRRARLSSVILRPGTPAGVISPRSALGATPPIRRPRFSASDTASAAWTIRGAPPTLRATRSKPWRLILALYLPASAGSSRRYGARSWSSVTGSRRSRPGDGSTRARRAAASPCRARSTKRSRRWVCRSRRIRRVSGWLGACRGLTARPAFIQSSPRRSSRGSPNITGSISSRFRPCMSEGSARCQRQSRRFGSSISGSTRAESRSTPISSSPPSVSPIRRWARPSRNSPD